MLCVCVCPGYKYMSPVSACVDTDTCPAAAPALSCCPAQWLVTHNHHHNTSAHTQISRLDTQSRGG